MGRFERNTPKNFGGSYVAPEIEDGKRPGNFILAEKICDMMKYGLPLVDNFPRRNRKIADTMRESMCAMLHLAVRLEKKYYKKTTLEDLDIELAVLKKFIVIASDRDYCGERFAPPLTLHQRDIWSRQNEEIGKLIGGYKKYIDGKTSSDGNRP